MKKSNKKGFTIVELVIVIAVIAILAAVLIPTFSNVVENAKKSAAMQNARNSYEEWLANEVGKKGFNMNDIDLCIKSGDYFFHVTDGQFSEEGSKTDNVDCTLKEAFVNKGTLVSTENGNEVLTIGYGTGA